MAKNGFFEIGAHGLFVDPYLAHVAIEFLAALFALKIDDHIIPFFHHRRSRQPLIYTISKKQVFIQPHF